MERNLETISLLEEQVEVLPQPRPVMIPAETVPTLRQRSTRTKQQPKWITSGDYVTKSAVTTSIDPSDSGIFSSSCPCTLLASTTLYGNVDSSLTNV
jgi:hypothetical protein